MTEVTKGNLASSIVTQRRAQGNRAGNFPAILRVRKQVPQSDGFQSNPKPGMGLNLSVSSVAISHPEGSFLTTQKIVFTLPGMT